METKSFEVTSHYKGNKEVKTVRYMTLEEAKNLRYGSHVLMLSDKNQWANIKVNGQPKTWKRNPLRCEVSWKYGQWEYGREVFDEHRTETSFVVEITK